MSVPVVVVAELDVLDPSVEVSSEDDVSGGSVSDTGVVDIAVVDELDELDGDVLGADVMVVSPVDAS